MPLPIRALLVDDNPDFLKATYAFLTLLPSLQVVGCVNSGAEALSQIPDLLPQLVLMDWTMPGLSGLEATRRIKTAPNAPLVVILTLYDFSPYRTAAHQAGADGFLYKADLYDQLLPLLQELGLLSA